LDKAPDAFRTISEVADDLDVPQHVLRFWETRFAQIKPMKRSGGRRYYRPDDVELLRGIRHLLYGQGYTIRGVQRILREQGVKAVQGRKETALPPVERPVAPVATRAAEASAEPELPSTPAFVTDVETERAVRAEAPSVQPDTPDEIEPVAQALADRPSSEANLTMAPAISAENRDRLRMALDELFECRRLLDAALHGRAA
jgi:DNA-binding transcriptional MerR regulator